MKNRFGDYICIIQSKLCRDWWMGLGLGEANHGKTRIFTSIVKIV